MYRIQFEAGLTNVAVRIVEDNLEKPGTVLELINDQKEHDVIVFF